MNYEAVYNLVKELQKKTIEQLKEYKGDAKKVSVISTFNDQLFYKPGESIKYNLSDDEFKLFIYLLTRKLGFSCKKDGPDRDYLVRLEDAESIISCDIGADLDQFQEYITQDTNNYRYELLLNLKDDYARSNHKDCEKLYFDCDSNKLTFNNVQVNAPAALDYEKNMIVGILKDLGAKRTMPDDDKYKYLYYLDNPSDALLKEACQDGKYPVDDIMDSIVEALKSSDDSSVGIYIGYFYIQIGKIRLDYPEGLSEETKDEIANRIRNHVDSIDKINNTYHIFVSSVEKLTEELSDDLSL